MLVRLFVSISINSMPSCAVVRIWKTVRSVAATVKSAFSPILGMPVGRISAAPSAVARITDDNGPTRGGRKHYQTDRGRRNKKLLNGKRSQAGGRTQETPAGDDVTGKGATADASLTDEAATASSGSSCDTSTCANSTCATNSHEGLEAAERTASSPPRELVGTSLRSTLGPRYARKRTTRHAEFGRFRAGRIQLGELITAAVSGHAGKSSRTSFDQL